MSDNCCAICSVSTSQSCGNCIKVYYCGKEHQKTHRKAHKEECFPAILHSDTTYGQHWITTRDIQAGEIIFNEYPLTVGPCGALPEFRNICLSCFKYLDKCRPCSKCSWPICSAACENDRLHARIECPILAANNISPPNLPVHYQYIFVLRCLFLKDNDPKAWKLLLSLESHLDARKSKQDFHEKSQGLNNFIRNSCKLKSFESDIIDHVAGVLQFNSYGLERHLQSSGVGMQIYYKLGKVNHSCIPNTAAVDLEPKNGDSPVSRGLSVTSTVFIPKGKPLLQLYGETLQGTYDRQRFLESEYFFTCKCERCVDPTELGTFYSGVKCTSKKCSGYLLPADPLDPNSVWKCSAVTCKTTQPYNPNISKIIKGVTEDLQNVFAKVRQGSRNLTEQIELNSTLESFLKKHEGFTVHPHHFTLVPVKMRHFQETLEILGEMRRTTKSESEFKKKFGKSISNEINSAKDLLAVFDTLCPGNSSSRGFLLKCLDDFECLTK